MDSQKRKRKDGLLVQSRVEWGNGESRSGSGDGGGRKGRVTVDGSRSWRWRARNIASRKNTSEISACGATIVERRTESIIASENVSINSATRPVYACMKITKLLITTAIN